MQMVDVNGHVWEGIMLDVSVGLTRRMASVLKWL